MSKSPIDLFAPGQALIEWMLAHADRTGQLYRDLADGLACWSRVQGFPASVSDWDIEQCVAGKQYLERQIVAPPARRQPAAPDDGGLSPDMLVDWLEAGSTGWGLDYAGLMGRVERFGAAAGFPRRFVDWDADQCRRARNKVWKYVQSVRSAAAARHAAQPVVAPVGNIHDDDPAAEPREERYYDGIESHPDPYRPAPQPRLDQQPSPPRPGRVWSWLKSIEERAKLQISTPWFHQLDTALKGVIPRDKKLDSYTDREIDTLYRFVLWVLDFPVPAEASGADSRPPAVSEPAAPPDPAQLPSGGPQTQVGDLSVPEWRNRVHDATLRWLRLQSRVTDEEPIAVPADSSVLGCYLAKRREASLALRRKPASNSEAFVLAQCQDAALLATMVKILELNIAEVEADLARIKAQRQARSKGR